jgi:hypothetical protein
VFIETVHMELLYYVDPANEQAELLLDEVDRFAGSKPGSRQCGT